MSKNPEPNDFKNALNLILSSLNDRLDSLEKKFTSTNLPIEMKINLQDEELEELKYTLNRLIQENKLEINELKNSIKVLELASIDKQANSKTLEVLISSLVSIIVAAITVWGPTWFYGLKAPNDIPQYETLKEHKSKN